MGFYGGRSMPSLTKVTFVNGGADPWSTASILPEAADFYEACVTPAGVQSSSGETCRINPKQELGRNVDIDLVDKTSHCEDMLTDTSGSYNKSGLDAAHELQRRNVMAYIK